MSSQVPCGAAILSAEYVHELKKNLGAIRHGDSLMGPTLHCTMAMYRHSKYTSVTTYHSSGIICSPYIGKQCGKSAVLVHVPSSHLAPQKLDKYLSRYLIVLIVPLCATRLPK